MNFRKVHKIITADGWKLIRIVGSHYQYQKSGCRSIVVPRHSGDLSIGVIRQLEKITGLSLRG